MQSSGSGPTNPFTVDAIVLRVGAPSRDALEGLRVLVVDDEADARELIALVLSAEGAAVTTSASATEGLAQIASSRYDVLVSDIAMPEHDGLWLIARARETRPDLQALALTGLTRREDVARVLAAGFDEHLAKPVDPKRLVEMVASMRS